MRTCNVPGCSRKHTARGYCGLHYERWRCRDGDITDIVKEIRSCDLEDCDHPHYVHGLCKMHHERMQKHGDLTTEIQYYGYLKTPEEKYMERACSLPNGCIEFIDHFGEQRPCMSVYGKQTRVTRWIYSEYHNIELTTDDIIHPMCENKYCVNIDHLEIMGKAKLWRLRH